MLVLPERERTKKGAIGVETKGVTCKIPLDLHNQISEEIRETESTMSKFIEMIIREHYEKGANRIMEKGRTLAFQVSEELFQRVKEYLENYEKAYHRRLTQKEFVIGLIEQALEEAEEEFEAARAAEHEEQAENGWEAAEIAESDEDEEVSDDEEPEDWDEENGETEGLSADEETTGSSWEPAENTETGEGEEEPSEDDEDMLRLAACLEEHFPHSIANAVVQEAQCRGLSHEEFHSKVEYIVAHGIASTVNEERVLIGSAHFIFEDEGVTVPLNEQERFDRLPEEYSHLYLAIGRELAAVICISDPLRREAKEVLTALRALGIQKTVMLTGDSYRTASTVANRLGVDAFCAEVLPADKAKFVADLRQKGHIVLMVGDGINDSPALSEADAGIAISDGAAIAREIADITIAADSLWELVKLRRIAMALMERIHSNYRFVIGFNGTLIGLGLAGILPPAASAALHNLSTLGVSLRSMSALPEPKQDNDRCI